jgi:hypothetical protein
MTSIRPISSVIRCVPNVSAKYCKSMISRSYMAPSEHKPNFEFTVAVLRDVDSSINNVAIKSERDGMSEYKSCIH